jgi:farnesyl-diphosphate farnesyltransferase
LKGQRMTTTSAEREGKVWNGEGMTQDDFMKKDECILCNENDEILGSASKYEAHIFSPETVSPAPTLSFPFADSFCQPRGKLHRAFSVFLFNSEGKLLLQQRAPTKVTFPNVWTNTCCSHPLSGYEPKELDSEDEIRNGTVTGAKAAAIRKLFQELGIPAPQVPITKFKFLTRLHYWAADVVTHGSQSPWGEHEIDYILFIQQDVDLNPNPDEVSGTQYVTLSELQNLMKPETGLLWSPWFRIIVENFLPYWWHNLQETLTTDKFVDVKSIHRFDPTTEHMGGAGNAGAWLGQSISPYAATTVPTSAPCAVSAADSRLKQGGYGKVRIHKHSLCSQLLHIDEVVAGLQLKYGSELTDHVKRSDADVVFCDDILGKVSRSFAAVIRQLPESVTLDIMVFYLVLRGLDTVEDDMTAFTNPRAKIELLNNFYRTALGDAKWSLSGVGEGDEALLLQEFYRVTKVFQSLSAASQIVISDITRRMGEGMAQYVEKDLGQGTILVSDYDLYCHYVAGLVGEGLSRLFECTGYESVEVGNVSTTLANTMGLFLQKTNIIRDYLEDYVDGRTFWPKEIWRQYTQTDDLGEFTRPENTQQAVHCLNHLITNALDCVPECLEYLDLLVTPEVYRFCAIPQVMAIATLSELYNNPNVFTGVVKIRKGLAAKLILDSADPTCVHKWFQSFAKQILCRVSSRDPNAAKTRLSCEAIIKLTSQRSLIARQYDLLDRSLSLVCIVPAMFALRKYQNKPVVNALVLLLGYPLVVFATRYLSKKGTLGLFKWLKYGS